ncbi:unnamed protein product [Spirodela intermedia]|uniref:Uncharacterized protein n=1 Tax=Spirodela intermedia TaxID=51605 RepID=A0A7I8IKM0_SPIIN|nr:unnamed protein product [Spirodela intermedia]CAA6657689.1 unnamed protein product [Spirodela intermedia]
MEEGEIVISGDLSDGGTPSRYELLTMVKQHSKFLREGMIDEDDTSDVEMDVKFWYEMLDLYFIRGRESKGECSPYFVRRWAAKLEKVAGENYAEVDWRRSFYLNFIAHTSFTVTVAICRLYSGSKKHQSGADTPLSPVYKVVKTVYASPSRVNFQTNFRKEAETIPAYPNICFAINDFDDAFDSVVLSETDHCYCVLLNADGGAAFPTEGMHENSSGFCGSDNDSRNIRPLRQLTLFSGFVSYPMVREAYEAGKSRFGSLWPIGNAQAKTDRLYMRGPGGRGEVEVAVSGVADQSQENSGPPSPLQLSKEGFGIGLGSIVRRAASAASEAAKQAYAAASATIKTDAELLPLKCCLMSVALPWENIAHDLLFKASPPVKL